jgi:predicted CxxxxCH...CXXCH cytochrome family protein
VPVAPDDSGHFDTGLPAELVFGPLARARGALPVFDGAGCSNIACHGGDRPVGGSNNTPSWTTVNGTQAACGTCHGLPPPAPHPARTDCNACHGDVIGADNGFVDGARHVNGTVEVACHACHGSDASPAPPRDLSGNEDTIFTGVGAHASHLRSTELHAAITCSECHHVPSNVDNPGHRDSAAPAEVDFGPLAAADDTETSWNGVSCATYCHGGSAAIQGGSRTNPSWTTVDGTQAACGSCHGLPPPAPHPTAPATGCGGCHPFSGTLPLDPALHINGVVERP